MASAWGDGLDWASSFLHSIFEIKLGKSVTESGVGRRIHAGLSVCEFASSPRSHRCRRWWLRTKRWAIVELKDVNHYTPAHYKKYNLLRIYSTSHPDLELHAVYGLLASNLPVFRMLKESLLYLMIKFENRIHRQCYKFHQYSTSNGTFELKFHQLTSADSPMFRARALRPFSSAR